MIFNMNLFLTILTMRLHLRLLIIQIPLILLLIINIIMAVIYKTGLLKINLQVPTMIIPIGKITIELLIQNSKDKLRENIIH